MDPRFQDIYLKKQEKEIRRQIRIPFTPQKQFCLNFSYRDALHLSTHPLSKKRSFDYAMRWGAGSKPCRLQLDFIQKKQDVEKLLASLLGYDFVQTIAYDEQFLTKLFSSLLTTKSLLVTSSFTTPKLPLCVKRFETLCGLQNILEKIGAQDFDHVVLYLETISPYTGEEVDLDAYFALCKKFSVTCVLNDTTSFSLLGKHGFGKGSLKKGCDILLGNFSKAYGYFASYIACSQKMHDYLWQHPALCYYKDSLSPYLLGLVEAFIELIPAMQKEREKIFSLTKSFYSNLEFLESSVSKGLGFCTVLYESAEEAKRMQYYLSENNCIVHHETVRKNVSRYLLRFFLHVNLTSEDLLLIQELLRSYRQNPQHQAL